MPQGQWCRNPPPSSLEENLPLPLLPSTFLTHLPRPPLISHLSPFCTLYLPISSFPYASRHLVGLQRALRSYIAKQRVRRHVDTSKRDRRVELDPLHSHQCNIDTWFEQQQVRLSAFHYVTKGGRPKRRSIAWVLLGASAKMAWAQGCSLVPKQCSAP